MSNLSIVFIIITVSVFFRFVEVPFHQSSSIGMRKSKREMDAETT